MLTLFSMKRYIYLSPLLIILAFGFFIRSTTNKKPVEIGCVAKNFDGLINSELTYGYYGNRKFNIPNEALASSSLETQVLGVAEPNKRYVEVDLSGQKLWAWDGDNLFLEAYISSGLPWWETPTGEFRIWSKFRATSMEGGEGKYYYNLPNVPYVMFFENSEIPGWRGYGLHGTYWHDDFGTPHSHGCVNLPTSIAEKLYYWVTPDLAESKYAAFSSDENLGTRVIIHD